VVVAPVVLRRRVSPGDLGVGVELLVGMKTHQPQGEAQMEHSGDYPEPLHQDYRGHFPSHTAEPLHVRIFKPLSPPLPASEAGPTREGLHQKILTPGSRFTIVPPPAVPGPPRGPPGEKPLAEGQGLLLGEPHDPEAYSVSPLRTPSGTSARLLAEEREEG
jgi:hypothetical protein